MDIMLDFNLRLFVQRNATAFKRESTFSKPSHIFQETPILIYPSPLFNLSVSRLQLAHDECVMK